jgi:hypothetical protein
MRYLIPLLLCLSLAGCKSAQREISKGATQVGEYAANSEGLARGIQAEVEKTHPDLEKVHDDAGLIVEDQQDIQEVVATIHENVTAVEDQVSPWAKVAKLWGWVLLIVAVVGGSVYFGLGPIIRRSLNVVGLLIPRTKLAEAKLLREAADENSDTELNEYIAAKRAADPQFDAAYRKVKNA